MSTTVLDARIYTVSKINNEWASKIRELLSVHNLTLRDAETFTNVAATRTYISDWTHGKVPQYQIAVDFLSYFPREEAIECLRAAGYDAPAKWIETEIPKSPEEKLTEALEEVLFRDNHGKYNDHTKDLLAKALDKINAIERSKEIKKRSEN